MPTIRPITIADTKAFLDLCLCLDAETAYMMYEPGERTTTIEQQQAIISDALTSPNSTIIVAEVDGMLAGYVSANGGEFNRIRHSAYLVAGVRQQFAGQGIGKQLFAALDAWAVEQAVERLELTVRVDNDPAIRLYQRMGYEIEGTKRQSLLVEGQFVDEFYMAKLLIPHATP